MTRIAISPASLRRTANTIQDVAHEYLRIARELETLAGDFPQMAPEYSARIRPELEAVVVTMAKLVVFHDPDVAAMRMAVEIIERDQELPWGRSVRGPLSILNAAYGIVDEVYDTAARYGMSLDEALQHMGVDKVTERFVRVLGEEGTVSPAAMGRLTGAAGVGLDFLEEYTRSDGSLWEATQRTLVSSGTAAAAAAGAARFCARVIKVPLITGVCMLAGGARGEDLAQSINAGIFDRGERTPDERQTIRAASDPSGITPEEQRQRAEEAREGFEQARRELVEEMVALGEEREEAERIAELQFPEYLLLYP